MVSEVSSQNSRGGCNYCGVAVAVATVVVAVVEFIWITSGVSVDETTYLAKVRDGQYMES